MLSGEAGLLEGFSRFDLSARKTIVAAVSGGGDSLALLLLLKAHLDSSASRADIAAVTVDHGLRPESAAEAAHVAEICAARGVPHETLRWEGTKPAASLPAAAREARHRLLAQAARSLGGDLVLTGHTADDQAETVLMRKGRGQGRGLAGVAPVTLFDGEVWFARPLLRLGREQLRAFLRGQGVAWIDDPSNENAAYERARARRALAASGDPDGLREALLAEAEAAAAARLLLGERAAMLLRAHAAMAAQGLVRLDRHALTGGEDAKAALYAFRLLLASTGGREHLPDADLAQRLLAGLGGRESKDPFRATACGAVVEARGEFVFLHREFRGDGPAPIPAVDGAVWDGRFRIQFAGAAGELAIGPAGRSAAPAEEPADIPPSLLRAALAAQPVLYRNASASLSAPSPSRLRLDTSPPLREGRGRAATSPQHLSPASRGRGVREADGEGAASQAGPELRLTPLVAPYARYLPSFDLAPARALAALFGAPAAPAPPFSGPDCG